MTTVFHLSSSPEDVYTRNQCKNRPQQLIPTGHPCVLIFQSSRTYTSSMLYSFIMRCGNAGKSVLTTKERQAKTPRPLYSTRPRTLTSPVPVYIPANSIISLIRQTLFPAVQQKTSCQSQSALLSTLPIEIRQVIWKEVVGGKLLHVMRIEQRLLAIECPDRVHLFWGIPCSACWLDKSLNLQWSSELGSYVPPFDGPVARPVASLSLLISCRQMFACLPMFSSR